MAFELFLQWLYLGRIRVEKAEIYPLALFQAWVMGDKFGCEQFTDYMMFCIIQYHKGNNLEPFHVEYAYDNSLGASKLRQWVSKQLWYNSSKGYLKDCLNGDWKTTIAEMADLNQDLTTLIVLGEVPEDPSSNIEKYLSKLPLVKWFEETSQLPQQVKLSSSHQKPRKTSKAMTTTLPRKPSNPMIATPPHTHLPTFYGVDLIPSLRRGRRKKTISIDETIS